MMYNLITTKNRTKQKKEDSLKIFHKLPKSESKFIADMNYGMLASNIYLLTDIADQLHELSKKINIVDRLSRYPAKGVSRDALKSYLLQVKKVVPRLSRYPYR